jgi:hypothetical protein
MMTHVTLANNNSVYGIRRSLFRVTTWCWRSTLPRIQAMPMPERGA